MDNSPLIYLDYDVSRYIYDTYYPVARAKFNKKLLNDQFKYFMYAYPEFYGVPEICHFLCNPWVDLAPGYVPRNYYSIYKNLDHFSWKIMLKFLKKHYVIKRCRGFARAYAIDTEERTELLSKMRHEEYNTKNYITFIYLLT